MRAAVLFWAAARDRFAQAAALQEEVQADHDQEGCTEDDGLDDRKSDARQLYGAVVGYRHIARVRFEQDFEEIGKCNRDAECDEQGHQVGALDDAVNQNYLQEIADQKHQGHNQRERGERVQSEQSGQTPRQVGADHQEFTVRQVDHSHDAPDHGKPQHHDRVETAEQQPTYKSLQKLVHRRNLRELRNFRSEEGEILPLYIWPLLRVQTTEISSGQIHSSALTPPDQRSFQGGAG